ncbi:hypothetical protein ACQ4M3_13195 [Leptolyngbya sp. AN03gr2]|uniref:hypothetical protein n=1 Tax=unclassified Leptolyngbya TaxID=2650499 RepID=UPI003D322E12
MTRYLSPIWLANHIRQLHEFFVKNFEPYDRIHKEDLVTAAGWGAVIYVTPLEVVKTHEEDALDFAGFEAGLLEAGIIYDPIETRQWT